LESIASHSLSPHFEILHKSLVFCSESADKEYEVSSFILHIKGKIKGKKRQCGLGGVSMKDKITVFLTFFLFLFFSASPLCADLGRYESDIIKVAFMNGCVKTLQWDMEKIRFLKENPGVLRKHVEHALKTYMAEVSSMNGEPYTMEVVAGSSGNQGKGKGWVW
jgi:hypothetical protein